MSSLAGPLPNSDRSSSINGAARRDGEIAASKIFALLMRFTQRNAFLRSRR